MIDNAVVMAELVLGDCRFVWLVVRDDDRLGGVHGLWCWCGVMNTYAHEKWREEIILAKIYNMAGIYSYLAKILVKMENCGMHQPAPRTTTRHLLVLV